MCKLSKEEFYKSRRCKEHLVKLLQTENDASIIADKTLDVYTLPILKAVIAATILSDEGNIKKFSLSSKQWANKYEKKIGFLKDSINLKYCSPMKVEQILTILLNR